MADQTMPARTLPRQVSLNSERIFGFYIPAVIFLSFFACTIHMPLGFLSFEDIAMGFGLLFCLLIVFSTAIVNHGPQPVPQRMLAWR
jgi:hypothetical protein